MARPLDRARSMPQLDRARSMPHIKGAHILRPCARCTGFQQQLERSQRANEATARAYAAAQAKRDEYEALLQAAQKKLDVQACSFSSAAAVVRGGGSSGGGGSSSSSSSSIASQQQQQQ